MNKNGEHYEQDKKICILCRNRKTVYNKNGEDIPCPCTVSDTVEIVGPNGVVSHRCPVWHKDLLGLVDAIGYTVRAYTA